MAAAGATVVPSARTAAEVEAVADEARDFGVEARGITADVTDDDDVEALVEEIVDAFGSLDILVNNAGFNPGDALGDPAEIESDAVDSVLDVNLRGAFRTLRAAGPHLKEAGGSVVNVASVAGEVGLPKQHPYVASKHGLVGLTKSAAMDWAPEVRVNAVARATSRPTSRRRYRRTSGFGSRSSTGHPSIASPIRWRSRDRPSSSRATRRVSSPARRSPPTAAGRRGSHSRSVSPSTYASVRAASVGTCASIFGYSGSSLSSFRCRARNISPSPAIL